MGTRKTEGLLAAGSIVTTISPQASKEITRWNALIPDYAMLLEALAATCQDVLIDLSLYETDKRRRIVEILEGSLS